MKIALPTASEITRRSLAIALLALLSATLAAQTEGELGEFGPPEGHVPGNPHPFVGSENPWNRRMFDQKPADLFYKRRGQRQILAIIEGKPEQAKAWIEERLAHEPDDPESLFMLTVAETQLGRLDAAQTAMHRALAAGLPFERFLAGPRELLAPLAVTPEFRELRSRLDTGLVHGPMLGDVGPTNVSVWVRTAESSGVEIVAVPLDSAGLPVRTVGFRTEAPRDFSGTGVLTDLAPATTYRYLVRVDGRPADDGERTFRTSPLPGTAGQFRVAFGGCAGYTPWHERIWDAIHGTRPDALLLLGDNVYLDLPGVPGAFHQYTYYRRQSRPEFRRLVASTAVYAIWDDHDAAMDDLWLGPYVDRPAWKQPNFDFFVQNWNNPPVADPDWPGGWHRLQMGDVEFFMIDGRSYRTNPFESHPTMLGPVQKKWLLDGLRDSTATFKVLVSPVNWVVGSKEGSRDTWQGFQEERAEIFDFLTANRIEGVFLLSSDRHRGDIWLNERSGDYPLTEFGSGYLTNIHTHDVNPDALFSYNAKNLFALLRFDTTRPDPEVTCEFRTLDGDLVHSLTLRRSELK